MGGMEEEREAADRAIRSIDFSRPWRFESAPASSQTLEESYLSKVRTCDIFVLILGAQYSEPVRNEYAVAVEAGKPVLAFVRAGERSAEQEEFLSTIGTKYGVYESAADLQHRLHAAVADEVVRRYRSTIRPSDVNTFLAPRSSLELSNPNDIIGYTIFGVEENSLFDTLLFDTLELFGGQIVSGSEAVDCPFSTTEIFFASPKEATEVFEALQRATEEAKRNPRNRQKAFLKALGREAAQRVGKYAAVLVAHQEGELVPDELGLRYLILAIRDDYAPIVRLLQAPEMMKGERTPDPSATRIVMRDVHAILAWADALRRGAASGDVAQFRQTMIEASFLYQFQKTILDSPDE
jgi:hypothetical protein